MVESQRRDEKEPRDWIAVIKKVIGIIIGILVVGFLIAVFLFGDLLRTGG